MKTTETDLRSLSSFLKTWNENHDVAVIGVLADWLDDHPDVKVGTHDVQFLRFFAIGSDPPECIMAHGVKFTVIDNLLSKLFVLDHILERLADQVNWKKNRHREAAL